MNFLENTSWYLTNVAFEKSMMLQYAVFSVNCMILFLDLSGKDQRRKIVRVLMRFIAGYIAIFFIGVLIHAVLGYSYLEQYLPQLIVLVIFGMFQRKKRWKVTLIMGMVYYMASMNLNHVAGVFGRLAGYIEINKALSDSIRNLFIVLSAGIAVFIRKKHFDRNRHVPLDTLKIVGAYNALFLLLLLFYSNYQFEFNVYGYIFSAIGFLGAVVVNLLTYGMLDRLCKDQESIMELQAKRRDEESTIEMMKISEEHLNDLRKLRHDLKNHCAYMEILLEENRLEELKEYFKETQESVVQLNHYVDCGNHMINSVLNLELAKISAEGYQMQTKLAVPPVLPFSEGAICSLLTNLIDNAIEACKRYEIRDAVIEVGISLRQEYLYLCVTNPVTDGKKKELLSLKTSKKGHLLHGYGSIIVDDIVHAYNGVIRRDVINNRFVVDVMLDLFYGGKTFENAEGSNL